MLYVSYHALNTSSLTFQGLENNITIALPCYKIGPLRCWPGGLCLSRSIGDIDVGEFIVPIPYVKQVKVLYCFHKCQKFSYLSHHSPCRCYPSICCLVDLVHFSSFPKLSNAGGRLIIASDGIWDALSSEAAAKSCRGLPAEPAAKQVVKVNGSKLGYRFLFSLDDAFYGCQ